MDRIYWIEHQGNKILFADYSNLSSEALVEVITREDEVLFPQIRDTMSPGTILSPVDVSNAVAS